MNRRHFVALLATPAIAQLLQACGSGGAPSNADTTDTTGTTGTTGTADTHDDTQQTGGFTMIKSRAARVAVDDPDKDAVAAVTALDGFAADLYARIVAHSGEDNVVFSPASILVALAMTSAGARGTTLAELDAVLHITDPAGIHRSVNALSVALASRHDNEDGDGTSALEITNSLWAQRGMTFDRAFLNVLAAEYDAGVYTVDYRSEPEAARAAINHWVAGETHQRIPELLGAGTVSPDSRLTLVNAIYLKASWRSPFESTATVEAPFTTAAGTTVRAKMMHTTGQFRYGAGDTWRAIDLPYLTPGLSMTVIVPSGTTGTTGGTGTGGTLPDLTDVVGSMATTKVRLALPRFDFDTSTSLAATLEAMGARAAFDANRADFTGMTTDEPLFISAVIHEANITVDESGTEAAAATAVGMATSAAPGVSEEPIELTVDRPFTFVIRDAPSGAVLFLGRVTDPTR